MPFSDYFYWMNIMMNLADIMENEGLEMDAVGV